MLGKWVVQRHGGRASDHWRQVYIDTSEQAARVQYERRLRQMRQGGVRLIGPDGCEVLSAWSPRLRTRW